MFTPYYIWNIAFCINYDTPCQQPPGCKERRNNTPGNNNYPIMIDPFKSVMMDYNQSKFYVLIDS